jgi:zinc protease
VKTLLTMVTLDEVNAVAQSWIVDENRVILASGPARPNRRLPDDNALRAIATNARNADVAAYNDSLRTGALVPVAPRPGRIVSEQQIPSIGVTAWVLSNGVKVFVKPTDFQSDQILIHGASLGGAAGLSPAQYYSARLAPLILERGGAGNVDASTLEKMLTGKRAALSADIGDREESISGDASPRDLQTFFELLWAKAITPRIDTAAFLAFQQQYRGMVKDRINSPAAAYFDTIAETMSQGHPLAKAVSDSIVQTLSAQIALDVYRDRFRDFSDFTFVIVGAVTTDAVRPFVEQWLGALPSGGRVETPHDAGVRPPTGRITKVVRKGIDQRAQTSMIITGDIPWSRDAAMRASAMTNILMIRMRETLREDLGGTYGVSVGVSVNRWPTGQFATSVAFGADPSRIDSLADVALNVLRRFAQDGPTPEELAKVREGMLRDRETALRSNEFWVELMQNQALWGDDAAESASSYTTRVRALDISGIKALARIVLDEANLARFTLLPEKSGRTP